jgi:hypothetical protein
MLRRECNARAESDGGASVVSPTLFSIMSMTEAPTVKNARNPATSRKRAKLRRRERIREIKGAWVGEVGWGG